MGDGFAAQGRYEELAAEGHVLNDLGVPDVEPDAPQVPTGDEVCLVCGRKRSVCRNTLSFTPKGSRG